MYELVVSFDTDLPFALKRTAKADKIIALFSNLYFPWKDVNKRVCKIFNSLVSSHNIFHHFPIDSMHPCQVSVSVKCVAKHLVTNVTWSGLLWRMFDFEMPVEVTFLECFVTTVQANILAPISRYASVHEVIWRHEKRTNFRADLELISSVYFGWFYIKDQEDNTEQATRANFYENLLLLQKVSWKAHKRVPPFPEHFLSDPVGSGPVAVSVKRVLKDPVANVTGGLLLWQVLQLIVTPSVAAVVRLIAAAKADKHLANFCDTQIICRGDKNRDFIF